MSETGWDDFDYHTPQAFWKVAVWMKDGNWQTGQLDVADCKRIFDAGWNARAVENADVEPETSKVEFTRPKADGSEEVWNFEVRRWVPHGVIEQAHAEWACSSIANIGEGPIKKAYIQAYIKGWAEA